MGRCDFDPFPSDAPGDTSEPHLEQKAKIGLAPLVQRLQFA
jgi:hypothetical protein